MMSPKNLPCYRFLILSVIWQSDALICRSCTYCLLPTGANTTCTIGYDRCIKLDVSLYVYRGCAKQSNCAADGSGLNDGGVTQTAWNAAENVVGPDYALQQLKKGGVVNCCSSDYCNGGRRLNFSLPTFLGLMFAFLVVA